MSGDLLIVGAGRLGLLVARFWREQQQQRSGQAAPVYLKFRSENADRARELEQEGYIVLRPDDQVPDLVVNRLETSSCFKHSAEFLYIGTRVRRGM
jgi:hypothetical protein